MYTFPTKKQAEQGFALLLSIIISSIVLAIGVSLLHLSISQINLASNARESEIAFQSSHAGIDCLWYWRNDNTTKTSFTTSAGAPQLNCFGSNSIANVHQPTINQSGGIADQYDYTFNWSSNDRCTQVTMYIMRSSSLAVMLWDLSSINEGIGTNGVKSCDADGICTIIVSRGYNRACANIGTSIFTIQREITFEF